MKGAKIIRDYLRFSPGWSCLGYKMQNISRECYHGPVSPNNVGGFYFMGKDPNYYRLILATF